MTNKERDLLNTADTLIEAVKDDIDWWMWYADYTEEAALKALARLEELVCEMKHLAAEPLGEREA